MRFNEPTLGQEIVVSLRRTIILLVGVGFSIWFAFTIHDAFRRVAAPQFGWQTVANGTVALDPGEGRQLTVPLPNGIHHPVRYTIDARYPVDVGFLLTPQWLKPVVEHPEKFNELSECFSAKIYKIDDTCNPVPGMVAAIRDARSSLFSAATNRVSFTLQLWKCVENCSQ